MEKFIVEGGRVLTGEIVPSGNKNEALPALAAALLTGAAVRLENLPDISDIRDMVRLLEGLGAAAERHPDHAITIRSAEGLGTTPDPEIARRIRGSFLFAAPLLARQGEVVLPAPGGDRIGFRRLDTHMLVLQQLGAEIHVNGGRQYRLTLPGGRFRAGHVFLDEASVTATENAVMAAAVAEGRTVLENAACEPHVQGLCRMLVAMGARIAGIGTNRLEIEGTAALEGCTHELLPDHTEVGSFIGLAAVTGSDLLIKDAGVANLHMTRLVFERLGVRTEAQGPHLHVPGGQELAIQADLDGAIPKIDDGPWPAFPSDLTSIATVVATQSRGTVLIFEKMFENRLFWVDRLIAMGAHVVLCDLHRAVISGPARLYGGQFATPDIRAGMALLIAAMCAEGTSEIQNVQQIDRGYEAIDTRLNALGAAIRREAV